MGGQFKDGKRRWVCSLVFFLERGGGGDLFVAEIWGGAVGNLVLLVLVLELVWAFSSAAVWCVAFDGEFPKKLHVWGGVRYPGGIQIGGVGAGKSPV